MGDTNNDRTADDIRETLAANIAACRKEKGLSRAELAKKIGVTEMAIGQYERGGRAPAIEIICKIASVLGVTVDLLVGNPFSRLEDLQNRLSVLGFSAKEENGDIIIFRHVDFRTESVGRIGTSIKIKYPSDDEEFVAVFKGGDNLSRAELFVDSLSIVFEQTAGMKNFVTQMAIEASTKNEMTIPDLALIDKRALPLQT